MKLDAAYIRYARIYIFIYLFITVAVDRTLQWLFFSPNNHQRYKFKKAFQRARNFNVLFH